MLPVIIIALALFITGTSYAYLTDTQSGTLINTVSSGTLSLSLDNESEGITLSKAVPQLDEDALENNEEYTFTVTNTGNFLVHYEVILNNICNTNNTYDVNGTSIKPDICIDSSYVKVGIKIDNEDWVITNFEDDKVILDAGEISPGYTNEYIIKIWLDVNTPNDFSSIDSSGNERNVLFIGNLNITGEQTNDHSYITLANEPELASNMIPVYYDETENVWRKADESNVSNKYKWYDYNNKMWANSITYDHTKVYNQVKSSYEGRTYNGTSDYNTAGFANYDFGSTITVATRFKADTTNSTDLVANSEGSGFELHLSDGQIIFYIYANSAGAWYSVSSTIETNTWYTVVGTYDGTTIKLYIDGKLVDSELLSDTIKVSDQPILIGANPRGGTAYNYFYDGIISDIFVLKDALTGTEISSDYGDDFNFVSNDNLLFYRSFDEEDKILNNAKYTEKGIVFNAEEKQYIRAGYQNYNFNNKITVISRFKLSTSDGYSTLIGNPSSAGFNLALYNKVVYFEVYGTTTGDYVEAYSDTLDEDTWYTAVGTYDGSTIKLYLNGELVMSESLSDTLKTATAQIFIGANPGEQSLPDEGYYFDGTMSDALVINNVLTEEEISKYYSGEINYQTNSKTLFYYDLRGYEGMEVGTEIPMNSINTMWVWIPRFSATANGDYNGGTQESPGPFNITFVRNTEEAHDAFTFGEQETNGFWYAKFETGGTLSTNGQACSNETCDISNVIIKPNITSLRNQTVSSLFYMARSMEQTNNQYGFSTTDADLNIHMSKNNEWGAVAYLTQSNYGRCTNGTCTEVTINNCSNYITGIGADSISDASSSTTCTTAINQYNGEKGVLASTTGNIYGIYDMSGGNMEYVMGVYSDGTNIYSGTSTTDNSGFNGYLYNDGTPIEYTDGIEFFSDPSNDKYYNIFTTWGNYTSAGLQHALIETYGWYNNSKGYPVAQYFWLLRGGQYSQGESCGIFAVNTSNYARANSWFGNRITLIVK